jgi:hypothetical protein
MLMLYVEHFEIDIDSSNQKSMELKKQQSKHAADKLQQYRCVEKALIVEKKETSKRYLDADDVADEDLKLNEESQNVETGSAQGIATTSDPVTSCDREVQQVAALTQSSDTPSKRPRGRPRKYPRIQSSQPYIKDPIDVVSFLGRRVCKVIGESICFGTIKKCLQDKEVNPSGVLVETTLWRVVFDDNDGLDVDNEEMQEMIRLYEKQQNLDQHPLPGKAQEEEVEENVEEK